MRQRRANRIVRAATLAVGLALPTLILIPFGSLWLWQHGYLLHWAIGGAVVVAGAYGWQRWLLHRPIEIESAPAGDASAAETEVTSAPDPRWTAAERNAWQDVLRIARLTDPSSLSSRDALLAKATDTIRTVAQRLHPEVSEPVWQFTMPEALAIIERVSRRLATFTLDNVPLSDRLTISRILALYRWRSALDVAERAYDVWRVIRLANPAAAATNEIREQLSREMLQWGRDHVMRQISEAYIREVGRAAIDLYGGRLRLPVVESATTSVSPSTGKRHTDNRSQIGRLASQSFNAAKALFRSLRSR